MKNVTIGSNVVSIPDSCHVKVVHLHPGNSTEEQRHKSKYYTIAKVVDREGFPLAEAHARCNPHDEASRKRGLQIALGRLNHVVSMYMAGI